MSCGTPTIWAVILLLLLYSKVQITGELVLVADRADVRSG